MKTRNLTIRFLATAAVLLFGTIACADRGDSRSIFAPLTNLFSLNSSNSAFSNELTDPANLPADVAVQQPPQDTAGSAPIRGIIALQSARLGRAARVDANVSVLRVGQSRRELVMHKYSRMEANRIARADSIRLHKRASILGTAEYNTIKLGKHASVANQITPLVDVPLLPPFLKGTPGTDSIGYQDSPLAAGNYGKLKLKKKKALVLSGGIYHFKDIRLSKKSSLICETTCVVLVQNRLRAGNHATLAAMSGKTGDLIFFVEGEAHYHHGCPHHHHTGVRLRKHSNTTADIYAPNGKTRIGRRASYTGNIIGKRVVVGRRARVVTGEEVPPRVARLFRAGEAGMIEIPGEIRLEVPAGALNADTVISIVPADDPPADSQAGRSVTKLGPTYELLPDGLVFQAPVSITMHYEDGAWQNADTTEDQLFIFTTPDLNGDFEPLNGRGMTRDFAANTITAPLMHFSLFEIAFYDDAELQQVQDLESRGNYLFSLSFSTFKVLDVSNPASPVLVHTHIFPDVQMPPGYYTPNNPQPERAKRMVLQGNYAYVVGQIGGLYIFDISVPASPVLVYTSPPGGIFQRERITIDGNTVFLENGNNGAGAFYRVNVTDPLNPVIGPLEITPQAPNDFRGRVGYDLRIRGNHMFMSVQGRSGPFFYEKNGLEVIDISGPSLTRLAGYNEPGGWADRPRNFVIEGNYLYLAVCGSNGAASSFNGVRILDISNPAAVVLAGSINLPIVSNLSECVVDLKISNNVLWTLNLVGKLSGYDVTIPQTPVFLEDYTIADPDFFAGTMEIMSNIIFAGGITQVPGGGIFDPLGTIQFVQVVPPGGPVCKALPDTWVYNAVLPTPSTNTFTCTASGLNYSCVDQAAVLPAVTYTWPSVAAANLGVLNGPGFGAGTASTPEINVGFRGSRISASFRVVDYALDGLNRLTSVGSTDAPAFTAVASNYDVNGFPQDLTTTVPNVIAYTYGSSGIPTRIDIGAGQDIFDYSNGRLTSWSRFGGFGTGTVASSGGVLICDPPPPSGNTPPDSVALKQGTDFSCAIKNGGVQCWGANDQGQLGNGTTTPSLTPVPVTGLTSNVVQVELGGQHACAVLNDGTVRCWGQNNQGQLGDGTTTNRLTPVALPAFAAGGVTRIAPGNQHTCAIQTGTAYCWGFNNGGILGTNDPAPMNPNPAPITTLPGPAMDIATNAVHGCAVSGGQAYCWGVGSFGLLGDGLNTSRTAPSVPVSGLTNVTGISLGSLHACALNNGGSFCWGRNFDFELGALIPGTFQPLPVQTDGLGSGVTVIQAGKNHTCAVLNDGSARCWGRNVNGQLAQGNTSRLFAVVQPLDATTLPLTNVTSLSVGESHSCAITNGEFKCWGLNSSGQLGDGSMTNQLTAIEGPNFP